MKNYLLLIVLCVAILSIGFIHSCTKNSGTPQGLATSYTEEFEDIYALTHTATANKVWILKNFAAGTAGGYDYVEWRQGEMGVDKFGNHYGFPAYSYSDSLTEYAYSGSCNCSSYSSWLITPVLYVKNGDKISFYTRVSNGWYADHLQVLMNKSASTNVGNSFSEVGDFTAVLFDINPNQEGGKYPYTWTKYEHTFSGISGNMNTRIAFRHYMVNPPDPGDDEGIGIDLFRFEVK